MTHALINALSQLSSAESLWLSLVIKVLIILLAMKIAGSSMEKLEVLNPKSSSMTALFFPLK